MEAPGEGRLGVHDFTLRVQERQVNYQVRLQGVTCSGSCILMQVLRLSGQVLLWVGEGSPCLASLAVGVPVGDCPATQVQTLLSANSQAKPNKKLILY